MRQRAHPIVILPLLAALAPLCVSCATVRGPLAPPDLVQRAPDGAEAVVAEAKALLERGSLPEAIAVLKAVGERDGGAGNLDEAIYLLGLARLRTAEPLKAARCFALLRRYYPRSPYRFPDLAARECEVAVALESDGRLLAMAGGALEDSLAPPAPAKETRPDTAAAATGPLVSNAFFETDVRQALADIAAQTGVSIVPDAMVQGTVSVEFKGVPLETCLGRLLSPLGLTFRKMDGFYLVGSPAEESPSYPLLTETRQIKPRFLSAEEVPKLLPKFYDKYVRVDAQANALTITAAKSVLDAFAEDLEAVDRPAPQIMIDAMVVEMSTDASHSLGLDWTWKWTKGNETYRISKLPPQGFDSLFVAVLTKVQSAFDLRATLRALEAKGKVKVRANPRVATAEGREATIRIARESYFSLVQGSVNFPYFSLEKIATGITLKITPHLGASSEITTDLKTEVSDVIASGINGLPVTNVRSVETRIAVPNGETIRIGGLRSQLERKEENRIPLLGEIPVLGALFGHTRMEKIDTEITILITPHLLIPPEEFDRL